MDLLLYPGLFAAAFAFGYPYWQPRRPRLTMLALAVAFVLLMLAGDGLLAFLVLLAGFAWAAYRWRAAPPSRHRDPLDTGGSDQ